MYFSVHAFHELAKQLLSEDGVDYVLSDKMNQDLLEEHFGKQRAGGGSNENPSLKEYTDNERKLLVTKSEMILVMQGNTRGRQEEHTTDIADDRLLPKRKKRGTKSII